MAIEEYVNSSNSIPMNYFTTYEASSPLAPRLTHIQERVNDVGQSSMGILGMIQAAKDSLFSGWRHLRDAEENLCISQECCTLGAGLSAVTSGVISGGIAVDFGYQIGVAEGVGCVDKCGTGCVASIMTFSIFFTPTWCLATPLCCCITCTGLGMHYGYKQCRDKIEKDRQELLRP